MFEDKFLKRPVPMVGKEPAKIQGATILVVVTCQQCQGNDDICLVNAQPAVCPTCGAVVTLDSYSWDREDPVPKIALSATLPRIASLQ